MPNVRSKAAFQRKAWDTTPGWCVLSTILASACMLMVCLPHLLLLQGL
jgi:hypothetical protein